MCVVSEVEEIPNRPARRGDKVELHQYKHAPGFCEAGNPNCIVCCDLGSTLELHNLSPEAQARFMCGPDVTVVFMQDFMRGINARDGLIIEGRLIPLECLPTGLRATVLNPVHLPETDNTQTAHVRFHISEAFKRALNTPLYNQVRKAVPA